jgi:hypothetical protein
MEGKDMKIISTHWFTELSRKEVIGIVTSENENGERSTHIGTGAGVDEYRDAMHIAKQGAKLRPEIVGEILEAMNV